MTLRIAAVSFLNTVPLVERLVREPTPDLHLHLDLPSRLPALLGSGDADVALVPVVATFGAPVGGILTASCIASDGAADSVKLFARGPLREIRTLKADRGSRTSVALARVLLAKHYGLQPEIESVVPRPGDLPEPGQAQLVIGDLCFAYEAALRAGTNPEVHSVDLGAWWRETTGLAFVFAVWALSPRFLATAQAHRIEELKETLSAARNYGLERIDELATRAAAEGRLGCGGQATGEAIAYYFRNCLRFRLGDREMAGMQKFHELVVEHGVLPKTDFPRIL